MVGIDAISVQSAPNYQPCKACPPLYYHVVREPPFQLEDGTLVESLRTDTLDFTDRYCVHVLSSRGACRSFDRE